MWVNKNPQLPIKNLSDAIILASIVEKEAGNENEKPIIAGVFLHRMSIGMKLQADPTIIYGLLPNFNGDITKANLRDKNNPDGDIEIIESGIRLGEKLYEELLIDAKAKNTDHPLIYRAIEKSIPYDPLMGILEDMKLAIEENNKSKVLSLLTKAVPELIIDSHS